MRKLLAASALLLAFSASPSMARDYSWCARTPINGGNPQCNFSSLRQCQATVSGQGGECVQNPRLAFGQTRNGRRTNSNWQGSGDWNNGGWDGLRW
jgi:hypothetical protein